jgi:translation initiation factor 2 beta subunit (eIF-2beta)/eIF-5
MKNIHIIPTDKPSRIYLIKSNNKLGITSNNPEFTENFGSGTQNQHIYIIDNSEFKEGWHFNTAIGVNKPIHIKNEDVNFLRELYGEKPNHLQKIILTTDQDLINDGVQKIDNEFLEWFVKNPSCEFVETENLYDSDLYVIVIPQEKNTTSFSKVDKSNKSILKLCPNGDIFVHGKLVENDKEVVEGLRDFLLKQGLIKNK